MSSCLFSTPDISTYGLSLNEAVRLLHCGGIVIFPTETLYGLGCLAVNADAVKRVYQLKRRPVHKPLPLLAADEKQADTVADLSLMPQRLRTFWPGPLTVLLPGRSVLPSLLTDERGLVAVRVTSHPLAIALASLAGGVLTASSANFSGMPATHQPETLDRHLLTDLGVGNAALNSFSLFGQTSVLCGPPFPAGGKPSTIVEPLGKGSGEVVRIVREGAIKSDALVKAGFVIC
ncbi:MAG: L-threonylcarbamoyladenylate synthase [Desulfovibrio sp.]|nr:L-threonylcarbamoyladenylate synthase [Desulfovibrio sp.]